MKFSINFFSCIVYNACFENSHAFQTERFSIKQTEGAVRFIHFFFKSVILRQALLFFKITNVFLVIKRCPFDLIITGETGLFLSSKVSFFKTRVSAICPLATCSSNDFHRKFGKNKQYYLVILKGKSSESMGDN